MDALDKAKELEQEHRQKGIEAVRETVNKQGTTDCIDCGEEIPLARRQAYPAATRCISCQQEYEGKT